MRVQPIRHDDAATQNTLAPCHLHRRLYVAQPDMNAPHPSSHPGCPPLMPCDTAPQTPEELEHRFHVTGPVRRRIHPVHGHWPVGRPVRGCSRKGLVIRSGEPPYVRRRTRYGRERTSVERHRHIRCEDRLDPQLLPTPSKTLPVAHQKREQRMGGEDVPCPPRRVLVGEEHALRQLHDTATTPRRDDPLTKLFMRWPKVTQVAATAQHHDAVWSESVGHRHSVERMEVGGVDDTTVELAQYFLLCEPDQAVPDVAVVREVEQRDTRLHDALRRQDAVEIVLHAERAMSGGSSALARVRLSQSRPLRRLPRHCDNAVAGSRTAEHLPPGTCGCQRGRTWTPHQSGGNRERTPASWPSP